MESLDVEGFRDHFQVHRSLDVTRVDIQNCGPQRRSRHDKKSHDGAMAMAGGTYDVLLVAEYRLYPPNLDVKQG